MNEEENASAITFAQPGSVEVPSASASTKAMNRDARRFLRWLDPGAENFVFCALPEAPGCTAKPVEWRASPQDAADKLARLNRVGCGIFVAIHAHEGRRTNATATRVRALFVDLDGAPLEPVVSSPMSPELVVETSPGKWHAYWPAVSVALGKLAPIQRALAAKFGGDPKVSDLARIMRLPGYRHRKGTPFVSRILPAPHAPTWVNDEIQAAVGSVERAADDDRLRALNRAAFWLGQLSHVDGFDEPIARHELELIGLDRGIKLLETRAEIATAFEAGRLLPTRGAA